MPDDFVFVKRSNRTPARPVECKADELDRFKKTNPEERVIYMCIQWPEIRNILAEQRLIENDKKIRSVASMITVIVITAIAVLTFAFMATEGLLGG